MLIMITDLGIDLKICQYLYFVIFSMRAPSCITDLDPLIAYWHMESSFVSTFYSPQMIAKNLYLLPIQT